MKRLTNILRKLFGGKKEEVKPTKKPKETKVSNKQRPTKVSSKGKGKTPTKK